ncbi:hypothetical protein BLNAU_4731 [Blattamonas nauphoetae]|uniref:Transmembrane protein n=1 Tax=Blattamonas nauphoetae TaxID=2049346 RepID=A0ABQ9Y8T4_9EUKA|nr:hypothetical protein BLNAU_4731 [Blattamonas nauphoetae]
MISSHVSNISTTTPTTAFSAAPSISPFGRSSVVGSDWIDTSNAFYGQIVGDLNSESEMISVNNTHTRSVRTGWYSASNAAYTVKQNITSAKTFNGDTFTGCYPPTLDKNNEGGALFIAASGIKVNLTSCIFTDCHASEGGAIRVRVDYTMTMIIDKCTFNSVYCTEQTGVYRSHNCGTDTITNCKFNNCTTPICGALFFIYASQVRVSGCTFTECKATTGSHSVVETFQTSYLKDLLFSNTSILKCSTKSSAQMYFVENCKFQSLVFHQCTTGTTDYGDVRGGTKHADLPSYSSNHMPHFNQETAELGQTINFPPWKVTNSGKNENLCGFYDKKCETVEYVLTLCTAKNRARTAYPMQVITLLDATHSIPAISLGDKAIQIQGEKSGSTFNTKLTASTPTATFLSVTTGRLFVKDLHLVALSGGVFLEVAGTGQGKVTGCKMDTTLTGTMSTAFATCATGTLTIETSTFTGLTLSATALISATSGTLTITSSIASSINLAKNGLITTSGTSVSVTGSTFTSISNENGDGGVLSVTLGTSNTLTVTTSSFKLNSATGRGGAVFVSTTSTVAQSDALPPFLTYGWDNEKCSATLGENVLVSCSSVSTELASRKWTTLKPALPERNLIAAERETFKIVDGMSSEKLLYHWYPHTSGEVHLHSVGEDHTNCGVLQLACVTMETAMTNMKAMKVVLIDSAFVRSTVFTSTAETWTLRQSSGCSLTLQDDGQIQIASGVNSALTLDTLTLGVGILTVGRSASLFSVGSGSLTFSSCQLTIPSTIPATLIPMTITGGSLVISAGTVSLPPTLSSTFVKTSAGTTTISGVSFGNSALSESLISGTGTMSVKNCSFSTLTSKSTISLTVGASQTLSIGESGKTTTFRDCSSSTDGGAICCFVKETGKLVVVSTSFSDCSSSGNGGSIFLSLASTNNAQRTWDFDLRGASFTTDSAAEGAAIFVSGSYFETAITPSRFPSVSTSTPPPLFWGTDSNSSVSSSLLVYLIPISNIVSVGGKGAIDVDDCGHFGVPCLTIGKGLERAIPSSDSIQIKVHANSALKSSYSVASSLSVWIVGEAQTSNGYLTVTTVASDTLIASSGSLSISQLAFTGTSDRSVSLLQLSSGGSLALTSCEFSGFSSSVGGSIVSGTSSISNGLKLTNVAFSSCSSSLDGGVIAVTVSSSSSLALSGSVSFTDCSSGTSNGHKMHITSSELITILSDSGSGGILDSILPSVGSTGIFTSAEKKEFWGSESKTGGSSGSLLFFRYPHTTGAVHLYENGEDHLHCGETTLPCQSLAHSLISMKSEKEVRLDSSLTLSTVFESPQPLWTLSASSTNSLSLTQNAQLSLTSSPSSTVTLFALPITIGTLTAGRTSSLFSVAAGSLTLSNCKITIPSTIPASLIPITVTKGSLVISAGTITLPSALSKSFLSSTAGTTTISAVSFANCALGESLISGTGTMFVQNCSFSALTSKSTISLTVGASQTLSIGESGKTTRFNDCSSSTDGGAICCFVKETGKLVVVSTSFSDCSSSGNGGSIFLSLTSMNNAQRTWDFVLSGASFSTDSAAEGAAIFVSGSYFDSSITPSRFPPVSSSTEPTLFWGTDTHSLISSTLLVYLVPLSNVVLVGGPSSMNFVSCGLIWVPCSTLDFGQSRLAASGEPKNVISVISDVDFSTTVTHSSSNELSIEGDTLHTLFLSSSARFVISFGSVSFSNLIIRLPSSLSTSPLFELTTATLSLTSTVSFSTSHFLTPFTSPVFLLHSGTLSTAGTQFDFSTQLTLTAASLMIVETASVQLTDSLFSNMKSTSDGAALHATITTNTLTIDHSSFKKCLSSERGGGILLDVAGMGGSGDYRLLGVEFGRVEEKNKADAAGHDVFVVGRVLSEVVTFNRWTGSLSGSSFDDLMGMDDSSPNFVSLLPLLIGNVFFVGPDGSDLGSGTESSPFLTLSKVLKEALMVENERMGVVMKGDAAIGGVVESGGEHEQTKTVTIEGSREGCRILCSVKDEEEGRKMKKREAMVMIRRHSFEISHLVLSSFSPSSNVNAVFSISKTGKLKLEGCSIRSESELSLSIISVKSLGEVELISFRTENVEFVGKGGVVGCGGESVVKMDGCEFSSTSFEDGAVVWGRTTHGLSILSSQFISCIGKSFGSLIRVSVVGCVGEIKGCSFSNCRTEVRMDEKAGVGGGCVVMEMDTRTTKTRHLPRSCVDLSESVFDHCGLVVIHRTEQRRCVGGSGFLVVGKSRRDWVSLRDVTVSDCVCSDVEEGKGFAGGVVGWTEAPVQSDRRGMTATRKQVGSVQI